MNIQDRFLKYVSFDTQSNPNSTTSPSTKKQLNLANYLVEELRHLGVEDVSLDERGIVYASIPSNKEKKGKTIGFIAHMDTSYDASGTNIKPQIIKDYDGKEIILNKHRTLDPKMFPSLLNVKHHDLITTDGTTLLGGDDKAGIAIIVSMIEYIKEHPEFPHNDIKIAFTSDEEIGKGTLHFDVKKFNADYAYTLDGGSIEEIEYENFNAYSGLVTVNGKSIHPGNAKDTMVNSIRVAYEFDSLLPVHARPESTEGYEGFNHLHDITGNCDQTIMKYIIRNHDLAKVKKQCQDFKDIAEFLNHKYGYQIIDLEIKQTYLNMKEYILDRFEIVEDVKKALKICNITPKEVPIRGGTDGANLTYMGLPCPNLGTGSFNCHGPYEFVSITMMKQQVKVLLELLKINNQNS